MSIDRQPDWRAYAAPAAVPTAPPRPARAGRPDVVRRNRRTVPIGLVVAAALAAVTVWQTGGATSFRLGAPAASDQMAGSSSTVPPLHHVVSPARLDPAVTPPSGAGGWTPIRGTISDPARWDPCRPIRYVISGRPLFVGGNQMLRDALATVSRDTGLRFEYAGHTDEPADPQRPAYEPQRYGAQWAPALIAWTDATQVPELAGAVVGRAGPDAAVIDGQTRLVSGSVYLDNPDLARLMAAPYGPSQVEGAMLHELGHLVGLGHSTDPNAVMYPTDHPNAGYDASDLRGLVVMGDGPCFSTY